ncbi:DUF6264 family protein [Pseudolysinimonas kribbensis]|uniref:DUF6264 family protein n=1 Tax=Pseudolysinimonas kribbensis TaxID=433641 RepID=UPI0024E09D57|nr:DUF6264 family protein [Pseudolysinimonas kribbensis]
MHSAGGFAHECRRRPRARPARAGFRGGAPPPAGAPVRRVRHARGGGRAPGSGCRPSRPGPPAAPAHRACDPGPPPPGHTRAAGWDGIATIALLAFGAYNVVAGIVSFLDMPGLIAEAARSAGVDDIRAPAPAQGIGYGLVGVWAVLFVVAIVWSMQRLRHGRTAFWVPLLVGVVALSIASITCLIVLSAATGFDVPQNRG